MQKTILFRVDASATMGMGHLLRCLALAQAFENSDNSFRIVFAINQVTQPFCVQRDDWYGELVVLPEQALHQEPEWLANYCLHQRVVAIVLDGYQFDTAYRRALLPIATKKILFDDNNNSGLLYADLVINGASNAPQLAYELTAPKAIFCLGEPYRMLRQEFIAPQYKLPWSHRDKLTVVLGGSDPGNLSLKILKQLELMHVSATITLATGGAYAYTEQLKDYLKQSALDVEHLENCQHMAVLFGQSRLVLSAAGGSQFELFAMHTPSLLLVIAENQRNATEQTAIQGWCESIDCVDKDNILLVCQRLIELWETPQQLEAMHQHANSCTQYDGASKVIACINKMLNEVPA